MDSVLKYVRVGFSVMREVFLLPLPSSEHIIEEELERMETGESPPELKRCVTCMKYEYIELAKPYRSLPVMRGIMKPTPTEDFLTAKDWQRRGLLKK